jgi:glycosyltransferase involved in cell wall biosynthesis
MVREPVPVLLMARELQAGGSERQMAGMALALDRTVFEPHVCCFHDQGFRADELRAAGIPILHLPVTGFASWSALAGALRFGKYLRQRRIGIVHAWDYPMNMFGIPLARAFGVPVVVSSQRAHRDLVPRWNRHAVRLTDQMVDAVLVNSEYVRRHLIADEKLPAQLIRVCHNGMDTCVFQPGSGPRPEALSGAALVCGVVCVLRPEKGISTLLEAFARVRRVRPGLKLVLVGSGPMLADLQALAARLGIATDVVFEPATRDVARWMRAIDVFVLPSLSEAFSNSLMEAMACGCAVVASEAGGNPELVAHGETGLLFRTADAADLAAALQLLIENDCLRTELGAAAVRSIRERFSWEASARTMERIYLDLLDRRGPRA